MIQRITILILLFMAIVASLALSQSNSKPDEQSLYWYKAQVLRIIDADTIEVEVDLGFQVFIKETIRFSRINAWEKKGSEKEKGLEAKKYLESVMPVGSEIMLHTERDEKKKEKKEKFGRWLADVWVNGKCMNDELVRLGHAKYQEY
jgi:micrococcal nuclease